MLTQDQLTAIRSQLTTITQGKWTVSPSPLADSRYMGFVCDCAQSHRDNSHQYVISDEHYGDAADDARFIAEAPTTIKLLLDEVDRLAALEAAIHKALPFGYLTLDYGAHHPNDIHCHLLAMDDDGNEFDYEGEGKDETEAINNVLNKVMMGE